VRLRALISFFSALSLPHLLWVRLQALDHHFECPLEPSPPSSAPSSPQPSFWVRLRALIFIRVRLRAFISFVCAFEPSSSFQVLLWAPILGTVHLWALSGHPCKTFFFYLSRSRITMRPLLFLGWVTHYIETCNTLKLWCHEISTISLLISSIE